MTTEPKNQKDEAIRRVRQRGQQLIFLTRLSVS